MNRSAAIFGLSILVLLAFGVTNWGWCCVESMPPKQDAESIDDLTDQQTPKAEAALKTAVKIQARSDYQMAINHFMSSETNQAIDLLEGIPKNERDLEWYVTRREFDGGYMTLFGHTRGVSCVAFSPDGSKIVSGGYDNKVKLWDGSTGAEIDTLPEQQAYIMDIGFGWNQNTILLANAIHSKTAIDLLEGEVLWNQHHPSNGGHQIAISPSGDRIASSGMNEILLIDARTGEPIREIDTSNSVKKMAFSPDGRRLAATFRNQGLTIWDAGTGDIVDSLKARGAGSECIEFSPDGSLLATSNGGALTIRNVTDLSESWTTEGNSKINCVGFSPDGRFVVSGCNDGTLKFWDAVSGKKRHVLRGHIWAVLDFDFHPDGTRIATGSADGTIKVWDARLKTNHLSFDDNASAVTQVGFGINHDWVLSASRIPSLGARHSPLTICIRNRYNGERLKSFEGNHYDLSPDGRFLAISGWTNLTLWEIESEKKQWSIEQNHEQTNVAFSFSPDGRWLASTDRNNKIKIRDALTGKESLELSGHESTCTCLCYSEDGRYLVSGSYDNDAKLWDANTGKLVFKFDARTLVESIAISPSSKLIATGVRGGLIKLWDVESKEELDPLRGHSSTVNSIVFNPASTRLVSGSDDGTVRIWDAESGEQLRTLRGHGGAVNSVAISPNGDFLASGNQGGAIVLWDARTVREEETIITSKSGWPEIVTFSNDFREIYSSFRDSSKLTYLGWSFSTKEQYVLPNSIDREIAKNLSPDNRWLAVPQGRKVLLVDQKQKEDPVVKRIRLKKSQVDPEWHRKIGLECEKRELWFAAKFHWDRVLRDLPKDQAAYLALGRAIEGIPTPKRHWSDNEITPEQEKFQSGKVSRISTGYFATPIQIPTDVFQRDITSFEVVLDDQDSEKTRKGLLVIEIPRAVFNEFGDVAGIESITSFQHSVTLVPVDVKPGPLVRTPRIQNRTIYKLDFDEPFCRRQLFLNIPKDDSQESKLLICLGKHQVVENVDQSPIELMFGNQPPIEMMYLLHSKSNETPKLESEETLERATLSSGLIHLDGIWVPSVEVRMNLGGRSSIMIDRNNRGISDFGDSGFQTLLGFFPIPVDLVDQRLPDPLKLGRRVFALRPIEPRASLVGQQGVDDIQYLLVVAAKTSGGHRLIVKSDRRIKHVFPMSDTGWKAHISDTKRAKPEHRKTLEEMRRICGNQFRVGIWPDGKVRSLRLDVDLSPKILDLICSFGELTDLRFGNEAGRFPDGKWEPLSRLVHLEKIRLLGSIADDELLKVVGNLQKVTELDVAGPSDNISDAGFAHLSKCVQLKKLNLSSQRISDASIMALDELNQLEQLTINESTITVTALVSWRLKHPNCQIALSNRESRKLVIPPDHSNRPLLFGKRMKLDGKFSQADYVALSKLKQVSEVELPKTLTLENLKAVLVNRALSVVIMTGNKSADNNYLVEISTLPNLQELNISGCSKLDDQCVDVLGSMSKLRLLSISHTEISQQALVKLRKRLPDCKISYH